MLRSLLAVLLLANYLLVVGAGLVVSRPEAPVFSAAHPYVHSQQCQQKNYLRLDCFEQCSGHRQEVSTKLPMGAGLHFLAQLKGLDVHCATEQLVYALQMGMQDIEVPQACYAANDFPAGFQGCNYPPPRRG